MMDRRISLHERVYAVDSIDWLARQVNLWAAWLAEHDFEDEADKLEQHAEGVMAVVGRLSRPIRPQLPPERWQDGQQQR